MPSAPNTITSNPHNGAEVSTVCLPKRERRPVDAELQFISEWKSSKKNAENAFDPTSSAHSQTCFSEALQSQARETDEITWPYQTQLYQPGSPPAFPLQGSGTFSTTQDL